MEQNKSKEEKIKIAETPAERMEEFFGPAETVRPAKRKRKPRKKLPEPELLLTEDPKKIGFFSRPVMVSSITLLFLVLAGTGGYSYFRYQKLADRMDQQAAESYLEKIGRAVLIPEGEEPAVATVSDKEKLADQHFFASAENGDKVLIYAQAQKVVLYRPSAEKVVEVVSLVSRASEDAQIVATQGGQSQEAPAESQVLGEEIQREPVRSATVSIFNGARVSGLANQVKERVFSLEGVAAVETGNAKGIFAETLIVDLSGDNGQLAGKIAETLGGKVGALPEGEAKPEGDILIIAGRDQQD